MKPPNLVATDDVITLAPGVRVTRGEIHDELRSAPIKANRTASTTLRDLNGRTVGEVAERLQRAYGINADRASADAIAFVSEMNAQLLVNLTGATPAARLAGYARAVLLSPAVGILPGLPRLPYRRRRIDTSTRQTAIVTTSRAVLPMSASFAVVGALLTLTSIASFASSVAVPVAAVVFVALALGPMVHESAHAAMLRGAPAHVVVSGPHAYVIHGAAVRRRATVAAAGPLSCFALGLITVFLGAALGIGLVSLTGVLIASHAIALTVLNREGRTACEGF